MKTILLATDFSAHAAVAATRAGLLAKHIGARVVCVHATIMDNARPDAFELSSGELEQFHTVVQRDVAAKRSQLQATARALAAEGIEADHQLLDGRPAEAVCEAARAHQADLVVIGSHGNTGLERLLLGSVAERVVRLCPTSVLVARRPTGERRSFHRVLALTDFEPPATNALAQAVAMADEDAEVDVLHCWHTSEVIHASAEPMVGMSLYASLLADFEGSVRSRGEAIIAGISTARRTALFHVIEGRPAAAAQRFAESRPQPYDLIAVGTHGRRGISRWLLGSTAEVTVRHATCSVLVARAENS